MFNVSGACPGWGPAWSDNSSTAVLFNLDNPWVSNHISTAGVLRYSFTTNYNYTRINYKAITTYLTKLCHLQDNIHRICCSGCDGRVGMAGRSTSAR